MEIFDPELSDEEYLQEKSSMDLSLNESNDPDKGPRLMERDIEMLQIEIAQLRSRLSVSDSSRATT